MADPRGVFSASQPERDAVLPAQLAELVEHHRERSPGYARILHALGHDQGRRYDHLRDLPWIPVRLFKHHELKSIPDEAVFKVVASSGTTGPSSRVHLDREAAATQQRMLVRTMQEVIGPARMPLLVVDSRAVLDGRHTLSARAGGVLGLMALGRQVTFALDETHAADRDAIVDFLARHGDAPFLVFGFTYLVWTQLRRLAVAESLDLRNGLLVHSGGWKKMAAEGVSAQEFRRAFAATGLKRIHNFYGMTEQIGTVFVEGPRTGHLHCPDFADVIIRDPQGWAEAPVGQAGVIEVISTLPRSYPGHVLLTEDIGVVHGIDDGDWPGKHFSVLGRVPGLEVRGCGDTLGSRP